MSLNSNKNSLDEYTKLSLENGYDRYTVNHSAFSIHNDLSLLLGSGQCRQENLFELKPQAKQRYTREMLFKIRNEHSEEIKKRIPKIFENSVEKNAIWDPEQYFSQTNTASFCMNNQEETNNSFTRSKADQELLSLIKGSYRKESLIDVPNKKKTNAFDQFVCEHQELVNESVMKHKIPKALTVQEIESQFVPKTLSFITVQELESIQFNQSKTCQNQMDVDDELDTGLFDDEVNVDINRIVNDKKHFNSLIQKLLVPSNHN